MTQTATESTVDFINRKADELRARGIIRGPEPEVDFMARIRDANRDRREIALNALFDAAAIALRSGATMAELNACFDAGVQAGNG